MKRALLIITLTLSSNANLFGASLTRHTSSESLPETWRDNPVHHQEVIRVPANPLAIIVQ